MRPLAGRVTRSAGAVAGAAVVVVVMLPLPGMEWHLAVKLAKGHAAVAGQRKPTASLICSFPMEVGFGITDGVETVECMTR
jgi:hypothetical protein